MRSRSSLSLLLSAVLLSAFTPLVQAAAPQNRVAGAINGSSRVAVPGNVSGHVKHALDLGAAPANQRLETLTLRFSMTAAQQADLNQLLSAQLNPTSPSYHQWLTPEQFGAHAFDAGHLQAHVTHHLFITIHFIACSASSAVTPCSEVFVVANQPGLHCPPRSVAREKGSTFINFSGTVAQAQQVFGTSITHTLSVHNGRAAHRKRHRSRSALGGRSRRHLDYRAG